MNIKSHKIMTFIINWSASKKFDVEETFFSCHKLLEDNKSKPPNMLLKPKNRQNWSGKKIKTRFLSSTWAIKSNTMKKNKKIKPSNERILRETSTIKMIWICVRKFSNNLLKKKNEIKGWSRCKRWQLLSLKGI